MKKICVIGTGYVGLVGAAIFSHWGNKVIGVDIDEKKIKKIQKGDMPIYEPGLSELVLENMKEGRLNFTTSLKKGIKGADLIFICVGTPQSDTGEADLRYVLNVAEEIGNIIKPKDKYMVIVTKSTVPVGTNEKVEKIIKSKAPRGTKFDVASNPEFLREGSSLEDMKQPDRTIIGSDSKKALDVLSQLYEHLDSPIVRCDLRSSEMIKYASNAFLATKISFINEIAQLCERAGSNVQVVADGMGLDKRIGRSFLNPSIGYGGSCFPKDVAALYKTSTNQAYDFKLLRSVMEVNELQRYYFLRKVKGAFGEGLDGLTFACLGLAFKDNTDDIRESVAIKIVQDLRGLGASIRAFDPEAMDNAKEALGSKSVYYAKDSNDALKKADALCLLTEWNEFRNLEIKRIKKLMKKHFIFDGRNLLNQNEVESNGFIYFAIGKRTNGYDQLGDIVPTAVLRNDKK